MFFILSAILALGFVVCILFISSRWKRSFGNPLGRISYSAYQSHCVLSPIWPDRPGFSGLKFSALRHFAVPLLSGALIYFVNIRFLSKALLALNVFYVFLVWLRYRPRAADYSRSQPETQKILLGAKQASAAVFVYAIFAYIYTFAVYCVRP